METSLLVIMYKTTNSRTKRRKIASAIKKQKKQIILDSKCQNVLAYNESVPNSFLSRGECEFSTGSSNSEEKHDDQHSNVIPSTFTSIHEEKDVPLSDSDSDIDCEEPNEEQKDILSFLRTWAIDCPNVPQAAITKLLKGLKSWFLNLPEDARTLMKTPTILFRWEMEIFTILVWKRPFVSVLGASILFQIL